MAKAEKMHRRRAKIEHIERPCSRCSTPSPCLKLVIGTGKVLKANWCPTCEEIFTQRGVRIQANKRVFANMQFQGKAAKNLWTS